MYTDLALSPSTYDPLAVSGASNCCHTNFVCIVNDEHELTTFWGKHPNLSITPC